MSEPANPDHAAKRGAALANAGKAGEAVAVYVDAAKAFGDPSFLTRAGYALMAAGEHQKAVKEFTAAIKAFGDTGNPASVADAYKGRGMSHRWLRDPKAAIDDLTKAIDLSGGTDGQMYQERGHAHTEKRPHTAATVLRISWIVSGSFS